MLSFFLFLFLSISFFLWGDENRSSSESDELNYRFNEALIFCFGGGAARGRMTRRKRTRRRREEAKKRNEKPHFFEFTSEELDNKKIIKNNLHFRVHRRVILFSKKLSVDKTERTETKEIQDAMLKGKIHITSAGG